MYDCTPVPRETAITANVVFWDPLMLTISAPMLPSVGLQVISTVTEAVLAAWRSDRLHQSKKVKALFVNERPPSHDELSSKDTG